MKFNRRLTNAAIIGGLVLVGYAGEVTPLSSLRDATAANNISGTVNNPPVATIKDTRLSPHAQAMGFYFIQTAPYPDGHVEQLIGLPALGGPDSNRGIFTEPVFTPSTSRGFTRLNYKQGDSTLYAQTREGKEFTTQIHGNNVIFKHSGFKSAEYLDHKLVFPYENEREIREWLFGQHREWVEEGLMRELTLVRDDEGALKLEQTERYAPVIEYDPISGIISVRVGQEKVHEEKVVVPIDAILTAPGASYAKIRFFGERKFTEEKVFGGNTSDLLMIYIGNPRIPTSFRFTTSPGKTEYAGPQTISGIIEDVLINGNGHIGYR